MSVEPDYSKYFLRGTGSYACTFGSSNPGDPLIQIKDKNTAEKNRNLIRNLKLLNINKKQDYLIYPKPNIKSVPANLKRGACTLEEPLSLVEIIDGGKDLFRLNVPPEHIFSFFKGFINIFDGLLELHKGNIAHLDVKPENMVGKKEPDGTYKLRLIDFGLSVDINTFKDYHKFYKDSVTPFNYPYWAYDLRILHNINFSFICRNDVSKIKDIEKFKNTLDTYKFPSSKLVNKLDAMLIDNIKENITGREKEILLKSDVFALGLSLYELIKRLTIVDVQTTEMGLIMEMCDPNPFTRLSLEEAKTKYINVILPAINRYHPPPLTLRIPPSLRLTPPPPPPNVSAPVRSQEGGNMKKTYKRKLHRKRRKNITKRLRPSNILNVRRSPTRKH
jgi:serine/threonine protein kinase